jgi:hypothetical protein
MYIVAAKEAIQRRTQLKEAIDKNDSKILDLERARVNVLSAFD